MITQMNGCLQIQLIDTDLKRESLNEPMNVQSLNAAMQKSLYPAMKPTPTVPFLTKPLQGAP